MKCEHKNGDEFDFLIGKSIIKVETAKVSDGYGMVDGFVLTCEDGTIIEIATNEGCGGCGNGWSSFDDLIKLQENHNVITNVICEHIKDEGDWYDDKFKLFIYYQDNTLILEGDDGYGNGYYGGGFYVTIKNVSELGE